MSMNKEELMNILDDERMARYGDERTTHEVVSLAIMALRIVIILVEIRESIDRLRLSINDVGGKIDDVGREIAETRQR